jgi:trans-aconitate methyltransferase
MTLPPGYFNELYARDEDPWGFADRWYEHRKRALTLALLPEERYAEAFEPGCSIGVLTRELAGRCDRLLATDVSTAAVDAARRHCAGLPNVVVERATLPADWPDRSFDLLVLSELGYYFGTADLAVVAAKAMQSRTIVAVHWRHIVKDYPQNGGEVHRALAQAAAAGDRFRMARHEDDDLLAEVWSADPRSVAERAGLT